MSDVSEKPKLTEAEAELLIAEIRAIGEKMKPLADLMKARRLDSVWVKFGLQDFDSGLRTLRQAVNDAAPLARLPMLRRDKNKEAGKRLESK